MKKETLLEIILSSVGGLLFAVGMCMVLVENWNTITIGIITSIIGFVILLCIIPIYRKNHPKKKHAPVNLGITLTWIIGIIGSLIMGFGMSKILTENYSTVDLIVGMITGVMGLLICILNYPIYAYIKNKD